MHLLVRVASVRREAEDINSYALVPEPGYRLPAAMPGAHIEVQITQDCIRQYSLCNGPGGTDAYDIAVKREPASRGGSRAMHDLVREGSRLIISEPKDRFPLAAGARTHVLIAGGIGITPLLSMLKHLRAQDGDVRLHYFTRSIEATAFRTAFESTYSACATLHVNCGPEDAASELEQILAAPGDGAHMYVCGPAAQMQCCMQTARRIGWPDSNVHSESFGSPATERSGNPEFELRLAQTQHSVVVGRDQTMLEALREAGIDIDSACEQGICGTCLTRVIEGKLIHRDNYLTDAEKDGGRLVLPCVSGGSGTVVLDL